jgi:hypothetical protein
MIERHLDLKGSALDSSSCPIVLAADDTTLKRERSRRVAKSLDVTV